MATAADPYFAAKKIAEEVPDVITLDIEMPRMDGITFLKNYVSTPHSVVIISTTEKGTQTALKALELGGVDIITKPQFNTKTFIEESSIRICDAVKVLLPMQGYKGRE